MPNLSNAIQLSVLDSQLKKLVASPPIKLNVVSKLKLTTPSNGSVGVSFALSDSTGISAVSLLRAPISDPAQAYILQSWTIDHTDEARTFNHMDGDLSSNARAVYWLKLHPTGTSGVSQLVGPISTALTPDTSVPAQALSISASHGAAVNGAVTVYVNVSAVPDDATLNILVSGYQGSTAPVLIATSASSPITVTLQATGELVTFYAQTITDGGTAAPIGSAPTTTLLLNSSQTSPAAPASPVVVQFSGGNQVEIASSAEPWVTSYYLYRGPRAASFVSAVQIATIAAAPGTSVIDYLDSGGLADDYAYYVVAHSTTGDSLPSPKGFPSVVYSSATLPPNVPINTTNNATIDSVPSGASCVVRIYGPGGIGTSYLHYTGAGSPTRPNGTISGLLYTTKYALVYDTKTFAHFAYTIPNYPQTLPDSYEFVGYVTTTGTGTATGSGATATAVIDGTGHVIQINSTANGTGYQAVQVNISGGGGSGAQATGHINSSGGVDSYIVNNGGSAYATAPTVIVVPVASAGTPGGGGGSPNGSPGGTRYGSNFTA